MKRTGITYYWAILLLVLASCSDETIRNMVPQTSFVIQVSGARSAESTGSRVVADREDNIAELDVILFRRKGKIDYYYMHKSLSESEVRDVGSATGAVKQFDLEIPSDITTLESGARIMVLANCRNKLQEFLTEKGLPDQAGLEDEFERVLFHTDLQVDYDWQNFLFDRMPMCGIHSSYIIADGENEMSLIGIDLLRMYARIDVGIDMYNPNGSRNSDLWKKFKIDSVYVAGYHPEGRIIRSFGEKLSDIHSSIPNVETYKTRVLNYSHRFEYPTESLDGNMREQIYVPESKKLQAEPYDIHIYDADGNEAFEGACDDPYNKQYNGIFLIIKATYEGTPDCYYRIDFKSRDGDFLPVLRNHKYEINITAVNGKGSGSLEEVLKVKPIVVPSRAVPDFEYEIKTY